MGEHLNSGAEIGTPLGDNQFRLRTEWIRIGRCDEQRMRLFVETRCPTERANSQGCLAPGLIEIGDDLLASQRCRVGVRLESDFLVAVDFDHD